MPILCPGARITNTNGGNGTLTCFAIKPGRQEVYGVTANHVLGDWPSLTFKADEITDPCVITKGEFIRSLRHDIVCFELSPAVRRSLTEDNFKLRNPPVQYTALWNPRVLLGKVESAQTYDQAQALRDRTKDVHHFGATTCPNRNPRSARLLKYTTNHRTEIVDTMVQAGDSGGPVFDSKKFHYVGMISMGNDERFSYKGTIIVLHNAFLEMGMKLATWETVSELSIEEDPEFWVAGEANPPDERQTVETISFENKAENDFKWDIKFAGIGQDYRARFYIFGPRGRTSKMENWTEAAIREAKVGGDTFFKINRTRFDYKKCEVRLCVPWGIQIVR